LARPATQAAQLLISSLLLGQPETAQLQAMAQGSPGLPLPPLLRPSRRRRLRLAGVHQLPGETNHSARLTSRLYTLWHSFPLIFWPATSTTTALVAQQHRRRCSSERWLLRSCCHTLHLPMLHITLAKCPCPHTSMKTPRRQLRCLAELRQARLCSRERLWCNEQRQHDPCYSAYPPEWSIGWIRA
jgi:hypothetical protein